MNAATQSQVLGSLVAARRVPLDQINLDQAQSVVRRIVREKAAVPKVGVAAFSSFI